MNTTALLRHRDFRLFYAGQSVSTFGDALAGLAIIFAILDLTGSAAALGAILLCGRLPTIALALLGGAVGDRFSRRSVMLAATAVSFCTQLCTGVLLLTGLMQLWMLVVLQLLGGAATAFFVPASQGLVVSLVPADGLAKANSLLGMSRGLAAVFALTLSAVTVATVGAGWAMVGDALTFVVAGVCLLQLPRALTSERLARTSGVLTSISAGLALVRHRPWLWVSIVHVAVVNMVAVSPLLILGPVIADEHLGGAAGWAAITVPYALGGLLGGIVTTRWEPARPLVAMLLCFLAIIPLLVLLAAVAPLALLSVAGLLAGLQQTVYVVLQTTAIQRNVPADVIARVSSVNMFGGLVAAPCGMAIAGPAAVAFGAPAVLTAAAALAVAVTAAALTTPGIWLILSPASLSPSQPETT